MYREVLPSISLVYRHIVCKASKFVIITISIWTVHACVVATKNTIGTPFTQIEQIYYSEGDGLSLDYGPA